MQRYRRHLFTLAWIGLFSIAIGVGCGPKKLGIGEMTEKIEAGSRVKVALEKEKRPKTTAALEEPIVPCDRTIVLDPGHGGSTMVGRSSANNARGQELLEKDLTLEISKLVGRSLATRGYNVYLTRSADTNLGLWARASLARYLQAAVFLSIHFNGFNDETTQGTETIHHKNASPESKELARLVQTRFQKVTELMDRGVKNTEEVGLDILVLRPEVHYRGTASALVEISFLTDPEEEERLKERAYREQIAYAVQFAIEEYLARLRDRLQRNANNVLALPDICRRRPTYDW